MAGDAARIQQQLTGNYLSQVQLLNFGDEFDTPNIDMNLPMSLNSSIFNGLNFGNLGCNCFGGAEAYYDPSAEDVAYAKSKHMNSAQWQDYMAQQSDMLEEKNIERQLAKNKLINSAQFRANAPDKEIALTMGDLNSNIRNNEQYKVTRQYQTLLAQVKQEYEVQGITISDQDARAEVESRYAQQFGTNLTDDIDENGSNYFTQGLKEGFGGGIGYLLTDNPNKTAGDNVHYIKGESRTTGDEAKLWAGRVVAGLITLPALIVAPKLLFKGARHYVSGIGKLLFGFGKKAAA